MATADIAIIGGGIIGTSIAYALSARGAKNIVLLEQETLAYGSSGRATGGIRQQFADELDIRCSIESVRFYEQFTQTYKQLAPPFYQYGYLFLATQPAEWQTLQHAARLQQSLGVPTQLLNATEVQQRVPQLNVDDVIGATFCPTDGYSDPAAMAQALATVAQTHGVRIATHSPVRAITVAHGHVEAVQTPHETWATRTVINATGATAALAARLAGIPDLPVYPLRRQLFLTEPLAELPNDVPMTVELGTGFHFRRRDGRAIVTMPLPISEEEQQRNRNLEASAFQLDVDEDFWERHVKPAAQHRCPVLARTPLARTWSGLYEMTPDEHPILGATEVEGFYCACGFSGHGFMHSAMAARLLTELLLDGASSTLPIELFSIDRFRTGKLIATTHLL
jgi:sarcosine oxidase subunit beta